MGALICIACLCERAAAGSRFCADCLVGRDAATRRADPNAEIPKRPAVQPLSHERII